MYNSLILYENLTENTVRNQNQIALCVQGKIHTTLMINPNLSQCIKQITLTSRGIYSFNQFRYLNFVNNSERQNTTCSHFYSLSLCSGFKVFNHHMEIIINETLGCSGQNAVL